MDWLSYSRVPSVMFKLFTTTCSAYKGTLLLMFLFVRAVEDLFEYHSEWLFFVAIIVTDLIIQTLLGTF